MLDIEMQEFEFISKPNALMHWWYRIESADLNKVAWFTC